MTSEPQVSVVVPTRNRAPMLRRALRSVLAQEDVDLELLVVDDGSTDATPDLLREQSDPRIVSIRHERSEGVARSRNDGIDRARAGWVAFLDDDDLWSPRKLRDQLALVTPDVALVYCGVVFVDEAGRVLYRRVPPTGHDLGPGLRTWNIVGGPSSVLARTAFVREVGGFDESLSVFADWDLWLQLAQRGRIVGAHEPLVAYLLHAANMHAGDTKPLIGELRALTEKHPQIDLDRPSFARWLAGGQRRSGRRLAAARTYLASGVRDRDARNIARSLMTVTAEPLLSTMRRLYERPRVSDHAWVERLFR